MDEFIVSEPLFCQSREQILKFLKLEKSTGRFSLHSKSSSFRFKNSHIGKEEFKFGVITFNPSTKENSFKKERLSFLFTSKKLGLSSSFLRFSFFMIIRAFLQLSFEI